MRAAPQRTARPSDRRPRQLLRVYSAKGRVAHLLDADLPLAGGYALCNRLSNQWFGTGMQREVRRAARLPLCPQCDKYAQLKEWT